MIISWFSAGVDSAIATKLAIEKYPNIKIIYIHIEDQHSDTIRFVKDCESWFNKKIEVLQSELKSVNNACLKSSFLASPKGASCSKLLKRRVRKEYEMNFNTKFTYIWGFDCSEKSRAERMKENDQNNDHIFPLIEKSITKIRAHGMLAKAGIKRPLMYELGYPNNNCIGCLRGGMGYWNKIKIDFPEVFQNRCKLEEKIGHTIFKDFKLKNLPEDKGNKLKIIVPNCGLFCEIK